MSLPLRNGVDKDLSILQTTWAQQLNPVIKNTIVNGRQINNINLTASTPLTINHLLSRNQQGWFITDIDANARVWRTEPFNAQTLTLESSADVSIGIWVY